MHPEGHDTPPGLATPVAGEDDTAARRRLCLAAMAGAPGLLRYAARFAPSLEDAEDAYQRGMEVALTKGPIGPLDDFIAWLHVVIRNEATTLSRRRGREAPAGDDLIPQADAHATATGTTAREPAAVAEWRERYRTLQDAMTSLNEAERVCLLLRTAGVSRAEIGSMTGYTDRKVERSIVRARKRLHAWHIDLASGERCEQIRQAVQAVADGEATSRERKAVSRHVRHCGPCRAALRARRQTNAGITALVPVAVVGAAAAGLAVPDPSPAMNVMERGTARLTVTVGQAWQAMLDVPSLLSARMGVGAVAITVAGVAGVPVVANTMQADRTATRPVPAQVRTTADMATAPAGTPTTGTATVGAAQADAMADLDRLRAQAEERRIRAEARQQRVARKRAERARAAREKAAERRRQAAAAPAAAPSPGPTPSAAPAASAASPSSQPQLEFGP